MTRRCSRRPAYIALVLCTPYSCRFIRHTDNTEWMSRYDAAFIAKLKWECSVMPCSIPAYLVLASLLFHLHLHVSSPYIHLYHLHLSHSLPLRPDSLIYSSPVTSTSHVRAQYPVPNTPCPLGVSYVPFACLPTEYSSSHLPSHMLFQLPPQIAEFGNPKLFCSTEFHLVSGKAL